MAVDLVLCLEDKEFLHLVVSPHNRHSFYVILPLLYLMMMTQIITELPQLTLYCKRAAAVQILCNNAWLYTVAYESGDSLSYFLSTWTV